MAGVMKISCLPVGETYLVETAAFVYTGKLVDQSLLYLKLQEVTQWGVVSPRHSELFVDGKPDEEALSDINPYPPDLYQYIPHANVIDIKEWRHPLPNAESVRRGVEKAAQRRAEQEQEEEEEQEEQP